MNLGLISLQYSEYVTCTQLHIRIFYNDLLSFVQHPASYVIVVAWQASSGQLQKVHRNLHIITKYKTDVPAEATCVQR